MIFRMHTNHLTDASCWLVFSCDRTEHRVCVDDDNESAETSMYVPSIRRPGLSLSRCRCVVQAFPISDSDANSRDAFTELPISANI